MDEIYSLGLLVSRVSVALSQTLTNQLKKSGYDLTHSQFVVLRALYFHDGQSQYNLAKLLCKDAAAIKRTIDQLVEKGYVVRNCLSEKKNSIIITEKGFGLIKETIEMGNGIITKALCGFTEKERTQLFEDLNKIYDNIEK